MRNKRVYATFAVAMLVFAASSSALAEPAIRPIEDFLGAQGTMTSFVPPVPDYLGWADTGMVNFALVDYAGLAAEYIETETGEPIGTTFTGEVTEEAMKNGSVRVEVELQTENALAFGFEIGDADWDNDPLPFLNTPLAFGHRAQDVILGAEPALASSSLNVVFIRQGELGDPLPDLLSLEFGPDITFLDYRAEAEGPLGPGFRDGGYQGANGPLRVHQAFADGVWNPEIVEIVPEPSMFLLLAMATAGLLAYTLRRQRR